jgi:LSD1 subclass zinc finger protein
MATTGTSIKGFACKGCGASLEYSPGTTSLRCPYCGAENEIAVERGPVVEHSLKDLELKASTQAKGLGVESRTLKCKNCGATTSLPPATLATKCPFCASDVVVEAPPNPNLIRPETVVPFQLNLDAANAKFREWLKRRWLAPRALKRQAAVGDIKGLYTPFFTFDARAFSNWSGEAGHYYYETERYTTMVNGRPESRTRQVQKIRWEHRSGTHQAFYNDELVCASQGLHGRLMEKLYPFDLNALVPYKPEFLAGWGAEEYTIDPRVCWSEAQRKMYDKEVAACSRLLDGDTQRNLEVRTRWSDQTWKHLLLPVYVSSYFFGKKTYRFLINGQTGEVQGQAPLSWLKVGLIAAAVAGVAGLLWLGRAMQWF